MSYETTVSFKKERFSIDEYLELENAAVEKHEYFRGEIFEMGDERSVHNKLLRNIVMTLTAKIHGSNYRIYDSELTVDSERRTASIIPVVSVMEYSFTMPTLLIEIFASTSQNILQQAHLSIPTLKSVCW